MCGESKEFKSTMRIFCVLEDGVLSSLFTYLCDVLLCAPGIVLLCFMSLSGEVETRLPILLHAALLLLGVA